MQAHTYDVFAICSFPRPRSSTPVLSGARLRPSASARQPALLCAGGAKASLSTPIFCGARYAVIFLSLGEMPRGRSAERRVRLSRAAPVVRRGRLSALHRRRFSGAGPRFWGKALGVPPVSQRPAEPSAISELLAAGRSARGRSPGAAGDGGTNPARRRRIPLHHRNVSGDALDERDFWIIFLVNEMSMGCDVR